MQQGKRGTQIPGKQKSKVNFAGEQKRFHRPTFHVPLHFPHTFIENCFVIVLEQVKQSSGRVYISWEESDKPYLNNSKVNSMQDFLNEISLRQ